MQARSARDLSGIMDDWQELVTQIEALESPITPAGRPCPLPPIAGGSSSSRAQPPPVPVKSKGRSASKSAPLPPKLAKARDHTLHVSVRPFLTRDVDADAREREKGRREVVYATTTPAVTRKQSVTQAVGPPGGARVKFQTERGDNRPVTSPFTTEVFVKPVPQDPVQRFTVDILPDWMHTTVWDGDDLAIYPWSGALLVTDYDPPAYFYRKHMVDDVWIHFYTHWEPRANPPATSSSMEHLWEATYRGHRIPPCDDPENPPALKISQGIAVENDYQFIAPEEPDGPFQWLVRFWVPVPMALFVNAEHKTFVCCAKVTMKDRDVPATEVVAERVNVGIERLRSDRLLALRRDGKAAAS
ncbi:hypothetical protein BN946_scf185001.g52 [Trametes cinnabarina]|uniref:Uncharacterized protein n=1 Tax=Pycnoporus cinnabarinus TaxID=5643 RepID=A0A060SRJ7_PYCCI|nr:hypothetical protein BN946_scf185001.g52 [Trametes cinnabarina]